MEACILWWFFVVAFPLLHLFIKHAQPCFIYLLPRFMEVLGGKACIDGAGGDTVGLFQSDLVSGIIPKLKQSIILGIWAPSLDNRAHVEIGTQASRKSRSSKQQDGHTPKAGIVLGASVDTLTHQRQALLELLNELGMKVCWPMGASVSSDTQISAPAEGRGQSGRRFDWRMESASRETVEGQLCQRQRPSTHVERLLCPTFPAPVQHSFGPERRVVAIPTCSLMPFYAGFISIFSGHRAAVGYSHDEVISTINSADNSQSASWHR